MLMGYQGGTLKPDSGFRELFLERGKLCWVLEAERGQEGLVIKGAMGL